ncbi:hypothetical protein JHK87_040861 [Glycine soja]|nr:hypothetical protein JHK87_040861 [Glycine soja]
MSSNSKQNHLTEIAKVDDAYLSAVFLSSSWVFPAILNAAIDEFGLASTRVMRLVSGNLQVAGLLSFFRVASCFLNEGIGHVGGDMFESVPR